MTQNCNNVFYRGSRLCFFSKNLLQYLCVVDESKKVQRCCSIYLACLVKKNCFCQDFGSVVFFRHLDSRLMIWQKGIQWKKERRKEKRKESVSDWSRHLSLFRSLFSPAVPTASLGVTSLKLSVNQISRCRVVCQYFIDV